MSFVVAAVDVLFCFFIYNNFVMNFSRVPAFNASSILCEVLTLQIKMLRIRKANKFKVIINKEPLFDPMI